MDDVVREATAIFTTIELTARFWQQQLEETSKQYTAFSIPGKSARYQFCVTPMGLQGSPASFARLMDHVMRQLKGVLSYIDDVLIHSRNHEEHLVQLEQVLLRLRKYGLKLNVSKQDTNRRRVSTISRVHSHKNRNYPINRQNTGNKGLPATKQPTADLRIHRNLQLLLVPNFQL